MPPASLDSTWAALEGRGPVFPAGLSQSFPSALHGEIPAPTTAALERATLPPQALQPLEPIEAEGIDLREVLYALARRSGVPIAADERLSRPASVHLPAVPLIEALTLLCRQERLGVVQTEAGFYVYPAGGSGSALDASPVSSAYGTLPGAETVGSVGEGVSSQFSSPHSYASPPLAASDTAGPPSSDGSAVSSASAHDASPAPYPSTPASIPPGVTVQGDRVSVNVEDTPLADILRDLARQTGLALIASSGADAQVTARWSEVPLEDALRILLTGTPLTYRRERATLVVADRQMPGMLTARLIPLRYVPAGGLVESLPDALRQYATPQLIQEQNALLVTGPADIVAATEAYLRELDRPAEQILLEVLVVEFETSGLRQLGVTFLGGLLPEGTTMPDTSGLGWVSYLFGGGSDGRGGLDVVGDGATGNRFLNFWSDLLGIRSIGRLPTDFFFRLQALEHTGKAEIRSRPHIATLNGHTATISIGTSQYYILKSFVPYTSGSPFGQGEVEHFEYVQADVRLEITPWVTSEGGVTATIRPSFTTPIGAFDPRIPPTLHNWSVDTSVRLADGETFMIGGLIQEHERVMENRIPLLGSLPLIGRFFRNTHREKRTGELVIFITPHILRENGYGGGAGSESEAHPLRERLAPNGSGAVVPQPTGRRW